MAGRICWPSPSAFDGRVSATDAIRVIGAGLRGAGHAIGDEEVAAMTSEAALPVISTSWCGC